MASPVYAMPITSCEQLVPRGETGVLMRDLLCPSPPSWPFSPTGVTLDGGATLDLNGFTISGDGTGVGVSCTAQRVATSRQPCTVTGPGAITAFFAGIAGGGHTIVASDLVVHGNTIGIYTPKMRQLVLQRVIARDNAEHGIDAQSLSGEDVEASGNGGSGVSTFATTRLRRLRATGNGAEGLRLRSRRARARVVDSTLTGNGDAAQGFDVTTQGRVHLLRTTCGRGARIRVTRTGDAKTTTVLGPLDCR